MISLGKFLASRKLRNSHWQNDPRWCVELRPVRVDDSHNLHAIFRSPDGDMRSRLLATNLTRSEAQDAMNAAVHLLAQRFAPHGVVDS